MPLLLDSWKRLENITVDVNKQTSRRLYKISLPESLVKSQQVDYFAGMEFTQDSLILKFMTPEGRVLTRTSPGKGANFTVKPSRRTQPKNTALRGFYSGVGAVMGILIKSFVIVTLMIFWYHLLFTIVT